MTGPEHYQLAEKLATRAKDPSLADEDAARTYAAIAQVHATLALAAATAMNDSAGGMGAPDWDDWREMVSAGWKPLQVAP